MIEEKLDKIIELLELLVGQNINVTIEPYNPYNQNLKIDSPYLDGTPATTSQE